MRDASAPGTLVALCGLAPRLLTGLMPALPAAVAVAAIAAAAQEDLRAAARAQVQAGGLVHAHPGTTEVLDGLVPARHTAAAPPSSARCRARYGRQACRQSDRCRAHLLRHRTRCTAPCPHCRRTAPTASAPPSPSPRPAPARPPCRAAWLARAGAMVTAARTLSALSGGSGGTARYNAFDAEEGGRGSGLTAGKLDDRTAPDTEPMKAVPQQCGALGRVRPALRLFRGAHGPTRPPVPVRALPRAGPPVQPLRSRQPLLRPAVPASGP